MLLACGRGTLIDEVSECADPALLHSTAMSSPASVTMRFVGRLLTQFDDLNLNTANPGNDH